MLGLYFGCLIILHFLNPLHFAVSLLGTERVPCPVQFVMFFLCSLQLLFKASLFQGRRVIKRRYGLEIILFFFFKQGVFKKIGGGGKGGAGRELGRMCLFMLFPGIIHSYC